MTTEPHGPAVPPRPPFPPPPAVPRTPAPEPSPGPAYAHSGASLAQAPTRAPRPAAVPHAPRHAPHEALGDPRTDTARPAAFAPPQHWAQDDQQSPVRQRPSGARIAAATVCAVLGGGLVGGAAAGSWLADSAAAPTVNSAFAEARSTWRSTPVDTLFPRALAGTGAGPGGADRTWTRVAVAPDGDCAHALDPLLLKALGPVGCERLLRATYTDATTSSVTTVGMVFTKADENATHALRARFAREKLDRRRDLMPRTLPVPGTVAAGFGDGQRASWTVSVLKDAPVVVYAVSGFADGRTVSDPQPAALATVAGTATTPAQAGLGHEAKGIADRIERALRRTVDSATEKPQ
ncbi:hypothetical protein [Streptomyces candidus]|uniref:Uncharacterized protein n=1 Tax=Streptomyces candidus TaxID=67283 RepID=A0A7X0HF74_9ACTN|nr:hypothetical protein [Streptomyces candidus]MBB6436398.1 hypothetical protein [Streptomyces candidus]GHH48782.1 hypothetical protein GCM10018773_43420 [Streptomyces candidus]